MIMYTFVKKIHNTSKIRYNKLCSSAFFLRFTTLNPLLWSIILVFSKKMTWAKKSKLWHMKWDCKHPCLKALCFNKLQLTNRNSTGSFMLACMTNTSTDTDCSITSQKCYASKCSIKNQVNLYFTNSPSCSRTQLKRIKCIPKVLKRSVLLCTKTRFIIK